MVRRNNRRNVPKRNSRVKRVRSRRRNGLLNGLLYRGTADPKSSAIAPWNSITVQRNISIANSTSAKFTYNYVKEALCDQIGLPSTTTNIEIRLYRIQAYDIGGRPLELAIGDSSGAIVATGYDYPGRNTWAHVGLSWPRVISAVPLNASSTHTVAHIAVGTPMGGNLKESTFVLVKLSLVWRIPNVASSTVFKAITIGSLEPVVPVSNTISKANARIKRSVDTVDYPQQHSYLAEPSPSLETSLHSLNVEEDLLMSDS